MTGLLTEKVKTSLEDIIKQCFYNNRIADRIVNLINVQFVMPNTEGILHEGYAHVMPKIADLITDYMADRDCSAIYGETPKGDQEYETPLECFRKLLEINLELELLAKLAIKTSNEEGDYITMIKVQDILIERIVPLTSDLLTLVDKAENYNASLEWMTFDKDIYSFGIFED